MNSKLQRLELFTSFCDHPILFIENLFNDGTDYYFIAYDFVEAAPSNHIHFNHLRKGKCINDLLTSHQEFDRDMFLTRISDIYLSSVTFESNVKWVKVK